MASDRSTNTMQETFQKVLRLLADAKAEPDADLEAIVDLETHVIQLIRRPADTAAAQGQAMGQPQSVMPGAPPGTPAGGGFSPPGAGMMSDPDELRRMLGQ